MSEARSPILMVDSVSDLYGSSRIGRIVLGFLREAGYRVDPVVAVERNAQPDRYAEVMDVPILVMREFRRAPVRHLAEVIRDGRRFARELRLRYPEHGTIYCNTFATLPAAIVGRCLGRRGIVHLHETSPGAPVALAFRATAWAFGLRVLAVSEAVRRSWGLASAQVVHNGIPDLPDPPGEDRPCDLIFVGRLTDKKGFPTFLDALRRLDGRPGMQGTKVEVIGGCVPGEDLPAGTFDGFLHLKVEYLGERPDAAAFFARSKVACIPSLFADPFPTTVLEAMRAGCLVVASDAGGVPEALEGTSSRLVPPGRAEDLADALAEMLAEAGQGLRGERNRAQFLARFTVEQFRARFLAAVVPVLEAGRDRDVDRAGRGQRATPIPRPAQGKVER